MVAGTPGREPASEPVLRDVRVDVLPRSDEEPMCVATVAVDSPDPAVKAAVFRVLASILPVAPPWPTDELKPSPVGEPVGDPVGRRPRKKKRAPRAS